MEVELHYITFTTNMIIVTQIIYNYYIIAIFGKFRGKKILLNSAKFYFVSMVSLVKKNP